MNNYKKVIVLAIFILCSCKNQNSTNKEIIDSTQINSTTKEEIKGTNFDTFFQKYRSDSVFQVNHTKYPLKSFYEDETGDTTINFVLQKDWKFNNFKDNRTSEYDQYEYKKEVINSNLVLYKMQGIDNGILVIYKFSFTSQEWILEEIEDASN